MAQELIIGYTGDKDYTLYGKLSDGTPIYKRNPQKQVPAKPVFEKKRVDEVISKYNLITETKISQTSGYNSFLQKIDNPEPVREVRSYVEDKPKVVVETPFYFTKDVKKDTQHISDTNMYASVFANRDKKEREQQKKIDELRELQKQRVDEKERIKDSNREKCIDLINEKLEIDSKKRSSIRDSLVNASNEILSKYFPAEKSKIIKLEQPKVDVVLPEPVKSPIISILDAYRSARENVQLNEEIYQKHVDRAVERYYEKLTATATVSSDVPDTVSSYLNSTSGTVIHVATIPPTEYMQPLSEKEERDQLREQIKQELLSDHIKKVNEQSQLSVEVPDYFKKGAEIELESNIEPVEYLDPLKEEEQLIVDHEAGITQIREKHKEIIETELEERKKSCQSYIRQVAFLNEQESNRLKRLEGEIDNAQVVLREEYSKFLVEQNVSEDFYDPIHEYEAEASEGNAFIVVTDKTTGERVNFKYVGRLSEFKLSGYKLKIFSISRKGTDREYISHNFTTYDLRDMSKIKSETFAFTKWDSTLLSESDKPAAEYATGASATLPPFRYGQLTWAYYQNANAQSFLTNIDHELLVSELDTTTSELHLIASAGDFTNLYLARAWGSEGKFTVDWAAVSATVGESYTRAVPGVDFTPASGTVTWQDGDTSYKPLTGIKILEDYESSSIGRRFDIQLGNITAYTYAVSSIGSVRQVNQVIDANNAQNFGANVGMSSTLSAMILPKHHGVFAFTTGVGSATDIGLRGWSSSQFGDATLSANAPGGILGGIITLGVERLSGTYGTVTVRCLVSSGMPPGTGLYDFSINDPHEGYSGTGAFNYASENPETEVSWNSPMINGSTYNEDSLSGQLQTLTWVHGESGVKYINLEHSLAQPYGFSENVDYPKIWYAVYLTFDTSTQMGISATGPGVNSTRVPTPCAAIINASHGRSDNPHNIDAVNTTRRGAMPKPFWVAIDTDNIDRYPRFFTFNITMNPGYGTPAVGNILIYNSLGVNSTNTYVEPTTSISFSARSHGTHSINIPASLITPTSKYIIVYEKVVESVLTKDWRFGTVELGGSINTTLPNTAQRNISAHIIEFTSSLSAIVPPSEYPYRFAYMVHAGLTLYNFGYHQGYNAGGVIGAGTRYVVFESNPGLYYLSQGFGAPMVNGDLIFVDILTTYNVENSLPVYSVTIPYSGGSFTSIFN